MSSLVGMPYFRMPVGVKDLADFRRWASSTDFPEQGRISYLGSQLWVDLSMETRDHNRVKTQMAGVLEVHVSAEELGEMASDRMRLTHPEAGLSTEPNGIFIKKQSLHRQRVQFVK